MSNMAFSAGSRTTAACAVPYFSLDVVGLRDERHRCVKVGQDPVGFNPGIDISAHHFPELRLSSRREQVNPEVRGADIVRLFHDEVPTIIES
jgi:hypothetical protein